MTKEKQHQREKFLIKSIAYGALTACISLPFQHPFDALKTNMQARQSKIVPTVKNMLSQKGWRAFYNGFSVNLLRVMIKQAYRWPLWISLSSLYKRILPKTNQVIRQTITGFSISFCELAIICPFQRIKIWLMTTKTQSQTKIQNYYKTKFNFFDLYTGFTAMIVRQGLSWSSFLAASEVCKNMMKKYKNSEELTSKDIFLISLPVSVINTIFIMPIDCIKTFYQQYEGFTEKLSFVKVIKNMYNKNGIRGLYLGWSARLIQYTIQSAFTLIIIQKLHQQYRRIIVKN